MDNDLQDKDTQLSDLIDLVAEGKKHFDSSSAYSWFRDRIEPDIRYLSRRRSNRRWLYAAAILIPFLFLSHFTYQYFRLKADVEVEHNVAMLSEVVVPNGSKTQLVLQDGTKVWVNSGSTLQCSPDFGKEYREIKLSGEAYLEVAHDANRPLVVSTGDVKVKVLGTRFNVNAYKENEEIRVALLEGSVEMLASGNAPLRLSPRDLALYNPVSKQTKVFSNATDDSINWIENKLIFDGETFEQIVFTLERSFNVKINILNVSVKSRRFAGDFVNNETIEQIFNVMSSDGKFKYEIKGNVIDIY
ncbi:MAG: FecR domain-containing protein [Tannerellaceae bacterium]|jgi:ferric-dicitrate binding protein FerR (iron transport regulator)|nr:FecR domain-containing protein [Tannerellaceae bacterium]